MAALGRPSDYSPQKAENICEAIAEGKSLKAICADDNTLTQAKVFRWLATFADFREMYARAREAQVEVFAAEIMDITDEVIPPNDNAAVQRARLRVDTRKWLMSKLAPKKYGDRIEHVVQPTSADQLSDDELARIAMGATAGILIEHRPQTESRNSGESVDLPSGDASNPNE